MRRNPSSVVSNRLQKPHIFQSEHKLSCACNICPMAESESCKRGVVSNPPPTHRSESVKRKASILSYGRRSLPQVKGPCCRLTGEATETTKAWAAKRVAITLRESKPR